MTKKKSITTTGKHPGGRPTLYAPKFCQMLIDHFTVPTYENRVLEEVVEYYPNGKKKRSSQKVKQVAGRMPTKFGFAEKIGVDEDTLGNWANARYPDDYPDEALRGALKNPEFFGAWKRVEKMQKEWLIAVGLSGDAPPSSFIFVAKNVTDMRDEQIMRGEINSTVRYIEAPKPYERNDKGYTIIEGELATDTRSALEA